MKLQKAIDTALHHNLTIRIDSQMVAVHNNDSSVYITASFNCEKQSKHEILICAIDAAHKAITGGV